MTLVLRRVAVVALRVNDEPLNWRDEMTEPRDVNYESGQVAGRTAGQTSDRAAYSSQKRYRVLPYRGPDFHVSAYDGAGAFEMAVERLGDRRKVMAVVEAGCNLDPTDVLRPVPVNAPVRVPVKAEPDVSELDKIIARVLVNSDRYESKEHVFECIREYKRMGYTHRKVASLLRVASVDAGKVVRVAMGEGVDCHDGTVGNAFRVEKLEAGQ